MDAQRALKIITQHYVQSTGLSGNEFAEAEALFDADAEAVICPACAARFKPDSNRCPDCGLQFG